MCTNRSEMVEDNSTWVRTKLRKYTAYPLMRMYEATHKQEHEWWSRILDQNIIEIQQGISHNPTQMGGWWPEPPCLSFFGMAPLRCILGPKPMLFFEAPLLSQETMGPPTITIVKEYFPLRIIGGVVTYELSNTPPMSMPTSKLDTMLRQGVWASFSNHIT